MTTLEAIKQSLAHHKDNVRKLEKGKEFGNDDVEHYFLVDGKKVWYDYNHCALCQKFPGECSDCPLGQYDYCSTPGSAWYRIAESTSLSEALRAERNMVKVLKEVMGKYSRRKK